MGDVNIRLLRDYLLPKLTVRAENEEAKRAWVIMRKLSLEEIQQYDSLRQP